MRRLVLVLGILLLVPTSAFAATKLVTVHKISHYVCYSASNCVFDYADEQLEEVDSAARLVGTDQVVRTCSNYPCVKEVETWYYWAVCYNGHCPMSVGNKEVESE